MILHDYIIYANLRKKIGKPSMKTYKLFSALAIMGFMNAGMSQIQPDVSPILAADKAPNKKFEISDCFNRKYYPVGPKMFQYIPGTEYYTLLEDNTLNVYNAKTKTKANFNVGSKSEFADLFQDFLNANPTATYKDAKISGIPMFKWLNSYKQDGKIFKMTAYFQAKNHVFLFKISQEGEKINKNIDYFTSLPENIDIQEIADNTGVHAHPIFQTLKVTGLNIAWVSDNQILIKNHINENVKITSDGGKGIVYGQSVHRNEFGINKGLFWATDGSKLAFYRMDERRVTDYPLFSIAERPAKPSTIKYPMAGDSSHTVTIGLYNLLTNKTIYLNTSGQYDQYLTNVTWSPDGNSIYVAIVNREQNEMSLNQYSAQDGSLMKTLFTHKHPKYIEPETGPLFVPNSNTDFIWQSELDGFNHLYLYSKGQLSQITTGKWEITDVYGFDKSGQYLIVNSTRSNKADVNSEDPTSRCPLAIQWSKPKNAPIVLFPNLTGTHNIISNCESGFIGSLFSNLTRPGMAISLNVDERIKETISHKISDKPEHRIYVSQNPIEEFILGEVSLSQLNHNGITLHTRTFFPPNFDQTKKYPVVVYLYGGPHAQMVTNTWLGGGQLWMHYMAQKGYIVFTVDNRGSSHRGLEFENATHRQLGTLEMEDQLFALNYLKSQQYVDSNRVGVHGWSFGGFMTTSLMTRKPRAYKVGVAGGPVIDWSLYEIMYTERYMDKPSENPEGYDANNLLNHAGNLKGRLLMIHGADDDVVVWQHSLKFVQKSVGAMNTNLDYYVYPGHKHNVVGPDRAHLYKKITQYFFDYL
jgi:dipeptidyl-peptidase-4